MWIEWHYAMVCNVYDTHPRVVRLMLRDIKRSLWLHCNNASSGYHPGSVTHGVMVTQI